MKFPGCILVRVDRAPKHAMFPKLNPKYIFKGATYFRYDRKEAKLRCLVTVMPDGTRVAWDMCGYCHHFFTRCTCHAGIQTCRSIEYIHDAIRARSDGEEWGMNHKNYRGSLTQAEREARKNAPQRFVMPDRSHLDSLPGVRPSSGRTAAPTKVLKRTQVVTPELPPMKLLKKSTRESVADATEAVDITKMHGAAEEMIEAMARNIGRKKLLKTTTAPKKLLRRSTTQ